MDPPSSPVLSATPAFTLTPPAILLEHKKGYCPDRLSKPVADEVVTYVTKLEAVSANLAGHAAEIERIIEPAQAVRAIAEIALGPGYVPYQTPAELEAVDAAVSGAFAFYVDRATTIRSEITEEGRQWSRRASLENPEDLPPSSPLSPGFPPRAARMSEEESGLMEHFPKVKLLQSALFSFFDSEYGRLKAERPADLGEGQEQIDEQTATRLLGLFGPEVRHRLWEDWTEYDKLLKQFTHLESCGSLRAVAKGFAYYQVRKRLGFEIQCVGLLRPVDSTVQV